MNPNDFLASHPYRSIIGIEAQNQHFLCPKPLSLTLSRRTVPLGSSIKETTQKHTLLLHFGSMVACMKCAKPMKIYLKEALLFVKGSLSLVTSC